MWCWECLWHDSPLPTSNLLRFILCHANLSKGNQILLLRCVWTITAVCFRWIPAALIKEKCGANKKKKKKRNTLSGGQTFLFNKQPASCRGPRHVTRATPLCSSSTFRRKNLCRDVEMETSCRPFAFSRSHEIIDKHCY